MLWQSAAGQQVQLLDTEHGTSGHRQGAVFKKITNSEKPLKGNDKLVAGILKNALKRKQNFGNEVNLDFKVNKVNFEQFPTIKLRNFLININSHDSRK